MGLVFQNQSQLKNQLNQMFKKQLHLNQKNKKYKIKLSLKNQLNQMFKKQLHLNQKNKIQLYLPLNCQLQINYNHSLNTHWFKSVRCHLNRPNQSEIFMRIFDDIIFLLCDNSYWLYQNLGRAGKDRASIIMNLCLIAYF